MHDALLTVHEVAARLRLSRISIYRRIAGGELPATKLGPGRAARIRVRASDVEDYLLAGSVGFQAVADAPRRGWPDDRAAA